MAGSHMRRYFAAVAPPKPPQTTITSALYEVPAQPAADSIAAAAESFRNSRRPNWSIDLLIAGSSALLRGEPGRHRVELRVGVALGDLVHHRGGPLAVSEILQLPDDGFPRQPC